jgi:glyoxylase-like metal-dependent hydrolase (beta-lactamase superfamily II)
MPRKIIILSLLTSALFAGVAASGQQPQPAAKLTPQAPAPMTAEKIKDNLYWFKSGVMANSGFYIGEKSVTVIDVKMTPDGAKAMIAAIAAITPKPIDTIILTHSDGDHVNGLTAFPEGLRIIASENTRKEMEEAFKDEKAAALRAYLPTVTFKAGTVFIPEGLPARLANFGPAHTSGDTIVFFPKEKAAFVGDLVFLGRDPLVHRQKGGTSFGLVRNLLQILMLDADVFISGHNDPETKADILGELKSIQEKQAKIKDLIAAGKSLDEIKIAFGIKEPPAGGRNWPSLVEVIYLDITEKRF